MARGEAGRAEVRTPPVSWRTLGIGIVLLFAMLFLGPLDTATRYYDFSTLSKAEIIDQAHKYILDRAGGKQMACVYVVRCDNNRARLEMVTDLNAWDLEATKATIFHRRLNGDYCSGRTTNIALHLVPLEGREPQIEAAAHARWSFFNDRFVPQLGRFQSGSFSDQPWERCTPERAVIRGSSR
jgi:hypothetical protein